MKIEAGLFWIRSWDEAGKEKSSSSLKSVFRSIHGGNSVLNIKDLFDPTSSSRYLCRQELKCQRDVGLSRHL